MGVWSQGVDPSGLVSESYWILCIISVSEMRPVLLLMIEYKSVLGQHWRKILLACFLKISSPSWQSGPEPCSPYRCPHFVPQSPSEGSHHHSIIAQPRHEDDLQSHSRHLFYRINSSSSFKFLLRPIFLAFQ